MLNAGTERYLLKLTITYYHSMLRRTDSKRRVDVHTFIRPGLADQTVVPADVPRVIPSQVNSLFIVDNSIMFG